MSDTLEAIESRLEFLMPLNKLPADRQRRLLEQSDIVKLRKKETLFKQGDRDDYTFYIIEGEIEMYADDSLIKHVTGGDAASFQPLAQLQPRQMSAISKTKSQVLRVNRGLLDQLLSMDDAAEDNAPATGMEVEEMESEQSGDWLMTLLQSELFTRIPPSNIQSLLDTLETVTLAKGEDVVKQGDPGDYYYAIQRGSCEVVRRGANKSEVKLAELHSGDTFGEEALISGAKRNATVRMTSDGELARLTKDDFISLIKAPLLQAVSRDEASNLVSQGAHWLDVRFDDEHANNGIEGSLNIPLSMLRKRMSELAADAAYVVYCDTGGRSSAAAFLLAEKGFEVSYVDGGAVVEEVPQQAAPPKATANTPELSAPGAPRDESTEARTAELDGELEKARAKISQAEAMMAEAEAMKRSVEELVANKLADERSRLDSESSALQAKLSEAEALRADLEAQRREAETLAAKRHEEIERRAKEIEAQARQRLADEEQRLQELYEKQAEQLESLQADREAELRESLQKQLTSERTKLEKAIVEANEELERAQSDLAAAEAAKVQATEQAAALIEQFKLDQTALLAEQQAAFDAERSELKAEAERIRKLASEAASAREKAEAEKAATAQELAAAKEKFAQASAAAKEALINEIEKRASTAAAELDAAIETENAVADAAQDNADKLERTYDTAAEVKDLLKKELDEWIDEQDDLQESTLQREILSRQKEMVERIRARAAEVKKTTTDRNQSLLDEIEAQLSNR